MTDVNAFPDHILAEIDGDIAAGQIPSRVLTFGDLHSRSSNDYLIETHVPNDGTRATTEAIAAVEDEVTRRLSAPSRPSVTSPCSSARRPAPAHSPQPLPPDGAVVRRAWLHLRRGHRDRARPPVADQADQNGTTSQVVLRTPGQSPMFIAGIRAAVNAPPVNG
ncbi:hypothetical protein DMB66_47405 [Actinoplanes sp. ATCC 53533]|uniref:hypothetical protein n=1 Tax=Actinoplanes sp. ATCC 53533 TaxID=1288362 RepID=UPI000F79C191|nr:hypothetical protein [Actinoplanes sp. ATCC 53533]RSM47766.1 hypothetical protein DMB66_47405 [Actinoplanes sp. ATCC 53533]